MRIITITAILFISNILSGCSEKEEEPSVAEDVIETSGLLSHVLNAIGLPGLGSVPLPMEIISLERELQGTMRFRYQSLLAGAYQNVGDLIKQDLETIKPQLVAKFYDMLETLLGSLVAQYPQIRAELESAAQAYRKQAMINANRGFFVDNLASLPAFQSLARKAQSLGIADALEHSWKSFNDQLVSELRKALKPILARHAAAVDNELDNAANTFISEYPEMDSKTRAALAAAKAHFRAEVAQL